MSVKRSALAAVTLFCLACIASVAVHAQSRVDLELVLAVDVSQSMDLEEQRLQRNGYVAAFRHRDIIKAIASGLHGRIAVSYLEWAGDHFQSIVIPWRTIASAADANAFADELASRAISREKRTSISNALLIAASMIRQNDIDGVRKVIDVSGDGPNNSGPPVALARDRVMRDNITVNGLAFVEERSEGLSSFFSVPNLDHYYERCVIGGEGSFAMPVHEKQEFTTAIRRKLLREIAYRPTHAPRAIHKAQYKPPASNFDCLVGEKKWKAFQNE
ncbi:MAG: DUF1194 domain-containing protein [Hyphomicrobiaceae bacterium]